MITSRYISRMLLVAALLVISGCRDAQGEEKTPKTGGKTMTTPEKQTIEPAKIRPVKDLAPLSEQEKYVIEQAGTERPFTGEYWNKFDRGYYVCRRCGTPLYTSDTKFESHCGWPSFDDEIAGAVKRRVDADGRRTEILCNNCGAHLGHVFLNEGFTDKNTRHCVNSVSLKFVPVPTNEKAYFAGGCFWGIEHFINKLDGVKNVTVGYAGGKSKDPTYKAVCSGTTGHAESAEVEFDPQVVSYEKLTKYFFEIHDPTQYLRQGNDVGSQYRSAIFYTDDKQKQIAENIIKSLKSAGYDIKTELAPLDKFYVAEKYHQDYLEKNPGGYCAHEYTPRFDKIEMPEK